MHNPPIAHKRFFAALLPAIALLSLSSAAPAAIIPYISGAHVGKDFYDNLISTSDLVNIGQASLTSAVQVSLDGDVNGSHDGTPAHDYFNTQVGTFPATITFTLNTDSFSGGSATGYSITQIQSIAGWQNADFGEQIFTLYIQTLANPSFVSYGYFSNITGFDGSDQSSWTNLTDSSDFIAEGVTAVRFIYERPPGGAQSTVLREIDIFGTATVIPEPGTLGLLILGSLALLGRRRRLS